MTRAKHAEFSELLGKVLSSCERDGNEQITFETTTGEVYRMLYYPDCCASCEIESIEGDLSDLVGTPIVMAEEVQNAEQEPPGSEYGYESYTWTFYKLATIKGYVTIRWFGSSNGYYSESASFERIVSE